MRPILLSLLLTAPLFADVTGWLDWRGPVQTGASLEKGLPTELDPAKPLWVYEVQGAGTPVIADGLLYAYGQFVITGDNGLMRTTIDTTDYAANVLPGGFFVESVAYGRRSFVAVGEDGYAVTSVDAVTWTSLASGTARVPPGRFMKKGLDAKRDQLAQQWKNRIYGP